MAGVLLISGYAVWRREPQGEEGPLSVYFAYDTSILDTNYSWVVTMGNYLSGRCIAFFTAGNLNVTAENIVTLQELPEVKSDGASFLVLRESSWPGPRIVVFPDNSTVVVEGGSEEDFVGAIDKLLLSISGPYALDIGLYQGRMVLWVIRPSDGTQWPMEWLGNISVDEAMSVPILDPHGVAVEPKSVVQVLLREYYVGSE